MKWGARDCHAFFESNDRGGRGDNRGVCYTPLLEREGILK